MARHPRACAEHISFLSLSLSRIESRRFGCTNQFERMTTFLSDFPPKTVLWGLPFVFLLHNIEEAIWMYGFLPIDPSCLPLILQPYVPDISYRPFLLALAIVTALPFGVASAANLGRHGGWGPYTLLAFAAVFLLNVFSHVGLAVLFREYTPGFVRALLLNLPVTVYALQRAVREQWIYQRALWSLPLTALLLHGPVLIGLMIGVRWLLHLW